MRYGRRRQSERAWRRPVVSRFVTSGTHESEELGGSLEVPRCGSDGSCMVVESEDILVSGPLPISGILLDITAAKTHPGHFGETAQRDGHSLVQTSARKTQLLSQRSVRKLRPTHLEEGRVCSREDLSMGGTVNKSLQHHESFGQL